jgi:pimeloyl-ACP methyl ester carboxylesterase
VVWAGSDGGRLDHAAVLLAAQGFCVLSLGVFGVEDRPRGLVGIELDWVDEAIRRLLEHPWSAGGSVALVSLSRGAELALQVAADNPRVGAVCAGSPSSLRQAGIVPGSMDFSKAAWLRSGDELPFMVGRTGPRDWLQMAGVFVLRRPMRQLEQFRRARRDHEAVARATIPVERACARLMLVVGEQDQLWPSAEYAEDVVERLRSHGWDGEVETVSFPEAGHFVSFPYALPTLPPMVRLAPSQAFRMDFGGSPRANAAAATASWSRLVHFLRDGETGDEPPRTTTSQEQT